MEGFRVFTILPVNGSDIAKCDSLYCVTKCSNICKTWVSQSHTPDCGYMKLQNPTWCKSSRGSLGYYCNSTKCSWTWLYGNNYALSAFEMWPEAMVMSQDNAVKEPSPLLSWGWRKEDCYRPMCVRQGPASHLPERARSTCWFSDEKRRKQIC